MTKININDPLVTVAQAAVIMGIKERKARVLLGKHASAPVRTAQGLCYRLDDVHAVRKMGQ